MGTGIDLRTFFQETYSVNDAGVENIFDFINASIAVAALEKPEEFQARRRRIIEAILMASPLDGMDQDDSSSSNTSCHCPDDQDQFSEMTSKPTNLGAKEKDCGTIQSAADDEEKNKEGKKLQKKIGTEDIKQKLVDTSQNKGSGSGSGSNEGRFEATKRKFEETSVHVKKAKRMVQFLDQFEESSSKPTNLGAKEKDCETIRSAPADDEENKNEHAKKKVDARSQYKVSGSGSGSGSNEGKFETTKRKFEETSLHVKKVRRTVQFVDHQFEELISKPTNLGAKEKDCGTIQPVVGDEEKKKEGKKLQRKIGTEDIKQKLVDARCQNKGLGSGSGSGSNEVKFEATTRKFEESSLHAKKAKRTIQLLDFKDTPRPELAIDENKCRRRFREGFKNSSFRRR